MKLPPFELERYFAPYEFTAKFLLCSSDSETSTVKEILGLEKNSLERLENLPLGYTDTLGAVPLREQIARIYSNISPSDIRVYSGAQEAIFLFMNAMLDSGDEVIVHTPCYQSLVEIPRAIGCRVLNWEAAPDANWHLDLGSLKKLITKKTKCIIVNFPHNPTGYLPSLQFFKELAQIADQHEILLFCDEVYRESEHSPDLMLPAVCDISEMGVSLGVMSKTYGLAGLRIGWLASRNKNVLEKVLSFKDYTTICNSALSELIAEIALKHRQVLVQRTLEITKKNIDLLDRFFRSHEHQFEWEKPTAGPIAFPKMIHGDVDLFCKRLVEASGVLLLPGSVYGAQYHKNFRIGFGRKNMPEALQHLEQFLKS